ncbi:hypothetical protein BaRGS_00023836 [Batillaria attramentaria]|uniref:Uncharacterized protein n=1 Tax=Batillaria attramentaria TaxID=370345 RepID=A0ABD0KCL2_9CAEN
MNGVWQSVHHNDQSLNLGKCLVHTTNMDARIMEGLLCDRYGKKFKAYRVNDFNFESINKLRDIPEFNASHSVFPMPDDTNHYKLHRYSDDFTNLKPLKGADKQDIQEVVKVSVDRLNEKYNTSTCTRTWSTVTGALTTAWHGVHPGPHAA